MSYYETYDYERLVSVQRLLESRGDLGSCPTPHPARPEARDHGYRYVLCQDGEPNRQRLFVPVLIRRFLAHREEVQGLGAFVGTTTAVGTGKRRSRGKRQKRAVGFRAWLGLTQRKGHSRG